MRGAAGNGDHAGSVDPRDGAGARHDRAVRRPADPRGRDLLRAVVLRLRRPRGARVPDLHQRRQRAGRSQALQRAELRRAQRRFLRDPAQQLRAGAHGRVFPHPARHPGDLPRQEHLCPLRHDRERDPARARMGRPRDAGDQQHHAPAGAGLRQRGHLPVPVPAGRRASPRSPMPTARANICARPA